MRLASKDRLLTHSINLDCHLGSPLAAKEQKYGIVRNKEKTTKMKIQNQHNTAASQSTLI
jgi:hypothetical protein